jgi:hypothetical protein
MTTQTAATPFAKEICFDCETHDYRATLDGQLIGYFKTANAAEVELDRVAHDWLTHGYDRTAAEPDGGASGDVPANAEPARFATVTVKATRSYERTITVFANSTVELVKHEPADSANVWMALLVDGRHYNLAMWKHTLGRPELTEALNQALSDVQAVISALAPDPDSYAADVELAEAQRLDELEAERDAIAADDDSYEPMADVNWNSMADPPEGPPIVIVEAPDTTPPESAFPICAACHTGENPPSAILSNICVACANAKYFGLANRLEAAQLAFTRQSIAIESRLNVCPNCQGVHHVQKCPELKQALLAPEVSWKDVALGRELCRMRWKNFRAFVALLMSVPTEHLVIYAESYIALLRDYNAQCDVTITDVLGSWMRMISDAGDRGPAAPALRMVA